MGYKVKTPVLYFPYSRIEYAKQSFAAIAAVKPERLYLVFDGICDARNNAAECEEVRRYVLSNIDWSCDVDACISKENRTASVTIYENLMRVFSVEERCIIIEEDVVPTETFFKFCDDMLEKYKDNFQVKSICGMNQTRPEDKLENGKDYYFSLYFSTWGWASWRDRMKGFTMHVTDFQLSTVVESLRMRGAAPFMVTWFADQYVCSMLKDVFDYGYCVEWDSKLNQFFLSDDGYCVLPIKNYCKNIGYENGVTTFNSSLFDSINSSVIDYGSDMRFEQYPDDRIHYDYKYDESFMILHDRMRYKQPCIDSEADVFKQMLIDNLQGILID